MRKQTESVYIVLTKNEPSIARTTKLADAAHRGKNPHAVKRFHRGRVRFFLWGARKSGTKKPACNRATGSGAVIIGSLHPVHAVRRLAQPLRSSLLVPATHRHVREINCRPP